MKKQVYLVAFLAIMVSVCVKVYACAEDSLCSGNGNVCDHPGAACDWDGGIASYGCKCFKVFSYTGCHCSLN